MAYKALYRTYRPQSFEEVAGQKHIVRTLKNALLTNKIGHAYLFCGPRGTGKTTMAKLFAKALNCEHGVGEQCNECSNCKEITEGSHPDVIEIDAASNNGVEQVRELIDKIYYLPIKGKHKVYIIDEVHMMTTNAFNALLKTLEEPPSHVIFILATTEPHNIIPTILSRCQRYDFTKVADADIAERMMLILDAEGISYEKEAVDAIVSLADGGVRDALSILDQILAYSGNELRVNDVYTLFGLTSNATKIKFIKAINDGDVASCLSMINELAKGGVDLKRLNSDLLNILKDALIMKKTNDESSLLYISEAQADELNSYLSVNKINTMINSFLKAQMDFKNVTSIQTLFEVVVLRLCTSEEIDTSTKKENKEPSRQLVENTTNAQKQTEIQSTYKKQSVAVESKKEDEKPIDASLDNKEAPSWLLEDDSEDKKSIINDGDKYVISDDKFIDLMVLGEKESRKNLLNRWDELNAYLGHPTLGDIVALIKDGKPFLVTKEIVVLEFDFDKLAQKLNIKSNQENVAKVIGKMMNKEMFVYGVSRAKTVELVKSYHSLRQISKLPRASDIKINLKEIIQ